jgi:glycosyltransferase involved in cell wall biosynthesis
VELGRVRFGPEVFRFQARGGVSRYFVELHRELLRRDVDAAIVAGLHISDALAGVPSVHGRSVAAMRPALARQALTRAVDLRVASRARRSLGPHDVWHPTYFDVVPPGRSALVVTCFDLIHDRYPEEVAPRDRTIRYQRAALEAADVVLCISQTTAADVQERFDLSDDRLVVTPLGTSEVDPSPAPALPDGRAFALYVGDRRPTYKGWELLLDAVALLAPDLALLCVGPPPSDPDWRAVADRHIEDRVWFEVLSDGELASRYRSAALLAYPSRYEGFGLPPLEALAHGCPVVGLKGAGAVEEVVGPIALLVDPTADALAEAIRRVADGDSEADRQRSLGPAHAARFTWSATAEATLSGYARAIA